MAVDWGDVIGGAIGAIGAGMQDEQPGNQFYGGYIPPMTPIAGAGGTVVAGGHKCKRRRRRRLLTESDFNDLMRIGTLPNKDTVKVALAKAVGRR